MLILVKKISFKLVLDYYNSYTDSFSAEILVSILSLLCKDN